VEALIDPSFSKNVLFDGPRNHQILELLIIVGTLRFPLRRRYDLNYNFGSKKIDRKTCHKKCLPLPSHIETYTSYRLFLQTNENFETISMKGIALGTLRFPSSIRNRGYKKCKARKIPALFANETVLDLSERTSNII